MSKVALQLLLPDCKSNAGPGREAWQGFYMARQQGRCHVVLNLANLEMPARQLQRIPRVADHGWAKLCLGGPCRTGHLPDQTPSVLADPSEIQERHTQHLQRLLLEAVANGSVTSARDIERLLRSTFAHHQHAYSAVHAATKAALMALR